MKARREFFRNVKELSRDEWLAPGSSMCAGCGGLASLRLVLKVLDRRAVVVNAAGCLSLLAIYPYTPMRASWLYTNMASAPAGAQGIRDALDILIAKHRLPVEEDLAVVVLAGDGATLDIGLASLSGAIHRNLDFYYLCYDNEAFGNTGFQMSSSSPFASHTATSPAYGPQSIGTLQHKKDLFEIWRAQRPPYIATVSLAEPVDLAEKVRRSAQFRGPKLFTAFSPCPPGWGYDPSQSYRVAKLALDAGVWPLKEAIHGQVRHTYIPEHRHPVEEYLATQQRFGHLFAPEKQSKILKSMQDAADNYWNDVVSRELPRGSSHG
jgi:pyruvate ferredoxin oxidoreductase beta subunit